MRPAPVRLGDPLEVPGRTDQLIAGLIMKIGGGLVLWAVITWIWFSWALEEERSNRPPAPTKVVT